ncbi:MAG: protoporphyrinogen/coproporphyrinogen oxidase [Planctomycetota bacterium]
MEFLIVGAGPTGIGAARRLLEHGRRDFLLLERAATPGGLAGSETDAAGFTWDFGGHVQFSHYRTFDDAMREALGDKGWYTHQRESWVWLQKRFVPYPFQNNIHRLDLDDRDACLAGLKAAAAASNASVGSNAAAASNASAAPSPSPSNLAQWAQATFGVGIYELFFKPYNFKVWAWPLETLSLSWLGDRVAVPDVARIERNIATNTDDVSWGPNKTFRFPKRGGTGAIWRALAEQLPAENIRLNADAVRLDLSARRLHLADGESIGFRHLISTLPLDRLAAMSGRAELIDAARGLVHSSTNLFGIGIAGSPPPAVASKCWMYFPESDCPFYRATVFSRYSPANVPDPARQWSLLLEVSESPAKPVDAAALEGQVIDGLCTTGLLTDRGAIVDRWQRRLPYGYPTPSLSRDAALAVLQPAFEAHGVYSRGRFGAWKYEVSNQDHSYMQGVEAIDRLLGRIDSADGPEPTLNRPNLVNRGDRP